MKNDINENDFETLIRLHDKSRLNEYQIKESEACGCFYCCRIFLTNMFVDKLHWCDEDSSHKGKARTAVCPNCFIDSIVALESIDSLSVEVLMQMRAHWFTAIDVDEWFCLNT